MREFWSEIVNHPLYWLLAAVPVAIALEVGHAGALWIFCISGLAIIPLAGLMGQATEHLAEDMGEGIGGLLNATFGNAAELIIAMVALWQGPAMYSLVKASITGSIIGNVLLVLGLSILAGGLYHRRQQFNRTAASMGATLLALAAVGLIMPALYYYLPHAPTVEGQTDELVSLSTEIACILAFVYILSLVFSLKTHQHLFAGRASDETEASEVHGPHWHWKKSATVLLAATAGIAMMSEFLIGSVAEACESLGMSSIFVGVIVVAIVGNAAEHSTAVWMAAKNKMDLAVNIAVGSSIQIALFVAPVLVFASILMGNEHALDLHFTPLETVAVVLSIVVLSMVSQDGESHWMEGVLLLATYVILALAFFHVPEAADPSAPAVHP